MERFKYIYFDKLKNKRADQEMFDRYFSIVTCLQKIIEFRNIECYVYRVCTISIFYDKTVGEIYDTGYLCNCS